MHRSVAIELKILAGAALVAALCACGTRGDSNAPSSANGGTVVIAVTADPDALFPPLASNVTAQEITELIYDYLADVGPKMNVIGDVGFTPALAESWTWSADSLSIAFHLNPKARWHDGAPVRAADVRFTHSMYISPSLGNPMGEELRNIDSVTTRDSLTSVFWFHSRTPSQFYTAASLMQILPQHILAVMVGDSLKERATRANPIGTGRFRFVSWTPGVSVEIASDTSNYRGRAPLDRVIWTMAPEYLSAITKLEGGDADVFEPLHAENVGEIAASPHLRVLTLPGMDYAFLQFNLHDPSHPGAPHPFLADRAMRRALTMAIDRAALVRNVFDTLARVSIGPTISALPTTSANLAQIPYDTLRAADILDSLGWRRERPDGMRRKNGRELALRIIAPATSSARNRMAVLIQSQLQRVGVGVEIEKLEFQAYLDREAAHDFDATLGAWHVTADPSAIGEVWTTKASRKKDGRNYGGYENPRFDAELDSAAIARDTAAASLHYNRAYQIIIDDAAAVWLYEPRTVLGVQKRIVTGRMPLGSWWRAIPTWSITPSERIQRDLGGVKK